jgi:hypothetical protein
MNAIRAVTGLFSVVAFAQTTVTLPRHTGIAVTGAPYSAELTIEDGSGSLGSQITHRALVYRNSEGKTRVDGLAPGPSFGENGQGVIAEITDPVAGVSDILDFENHIAHRVALEGLTFIVVGCCPEKTISWRSTEYVLLNSAGKSMPEFGPGARGDGGKVGGPGMIDGLPAEGYSQIITAPVGGLQLNFQPIVFGIESWYSETLKVTLLYKLSDSRDGETTIRLTNIRPGEPDPSLFEVPAGYRTIEERSTFTINSARR